MIRLAPALRGWQPNGRGGLILTLVFSCAYLAWGFPKGFITGTGSYWQVQTQDVTVYVSGFMAFFQEPWRWPLLRIESINWPEGTLVTFVDAIPLFALVLKLLVPANVGPFNPYGYWVGSCLILQGIGGWWILREARINNWGSLLAVSLLLLTMPVLQQRMGHISLFSQWILVFALALYVRGLRLGDSAGLGWCLLLLGSLYINIYLTAMAALVYMADLWLHRGRPSWLRWCFWPLLTVFLALATLRLLVWPLPGHHWVREGGFGLLSMNLLGPLTGSGFFSFSTPSANPYQSVEGFSYLGAGVLFLLVLVVITHRCRKTQLATTPELRLLNGPMALVLTAVILYALSNKITLGPDVIVTWSVPAWAQELTGQFRASGRFFWLVAYFVTISLVITTSRRFSGSLLLLILGLAVVLQLADRITALKHLHGLVTPTASMVLNNDAWKKEVGSQVQTMYFYPKMRCGKISSFYDTLLPVMRFAAENKIKLNTGYMARYAPDCGEEAAEIQASNPEQSAYVFVTAEYAPETIHSILPVTVKDHCRQIDFATLCGATSKGEQ